jgi:hypothetical protein
VLSATLARCATGATIGTAWEARWLPLVRPSRVAPMRNAASLDNARACRLARLDSRQPPTTGS